MDRLLPIVESPKGNQYMLWRQTMCTFDGTPYTMLPEARSWPVIAYVTCLFAWQRGEVTPVEDVGIGK